MEWPARPPPVGGGGVSIAEIFATIAKISLCVRNFRYVK